MRKKEILHQILLGMDAYLSCGVPDIYWELAEILVSKKYGLAGLILLNKYHETYEDTKTLHTIHGWDDTNTEVNPTELINKLEQLKN